MTDRRRSREGRRELTRARRWSVTLAPWVLTLVITGCRSGQETPVTSDLGQPLPGLSDAERGSFLLGKALFQRLATQDEGLGPLFNADRCSSCHDAPTSGGGGTELPVLKATRFTPDGCDLLTSTGGDNVQLRATPQLLAHGGGPETIPPGATASVYVVSPPLYGLGLLEAVPEADLARLADPDDLDGDGVSGRLPRLPDGRSARFGRKGDAADLAGFVDSALRFELGLTTPDNPVEEARNGVPVPAEADPTAEPEIDRRGVDLLTSYVRLLGAPASMTPISDTAAVGGELFRRIGCTACHVPELRTGPSDVAALDNRTIRPYSDLLVHDLGDSDSDVCGRDVDPGEYRTAPLWGLRHRHRYMHDGNATHLIGALSRHGGEAAGARSNFLALDEHDRLALLAFLASL